MVIAFKYSLVIKKIINVHEAINDTSFFCKVEKLEKSVIIYKKIDPTEEIFQCKIILRLY